MDLVESGLLANERIRPLKRSEYDRLVEMDAFAGERVELLFGRIVAMSPQNRPHSWTVSRLAEWLIGSLGGKVEVLIQGPLAASDEHEPEPDIALVQRNPSTKDHPTSAHLVIEVADSSRQRDLGLKPAIYAAMNVADYWVVDLQRREIVIHRDPARDRYRQISTFGDDATVALLAFPEVSARVADLLPPVQG